ncbi:hypothetical protein BKH23_10920 [Actinomyces oris]|uniref:hypothetical protein n=1 Tax=Actinomyces TaxID=1654 RepID=UPI00094CC4BC|nr:MULTISPECIES: hypothetical protein [Actinomyces]OLO59624.1 hypothetical protein BKH23_10920 [Actinomyces oris]
MRATHPFTRPSSALRRLSALATAATLALTITSCSVGDSDDGPVISPLNAQEANAAAPNNSRSLMDSDPLPTAEGTVTMSTSDQNRKKGTVAGDLTTTVVSRAPSTDKVQWAVSIKPVAANEERTEYADNAQSAMKEDMGRSSTGSTVVSPDGRYLSLILLPAEQQSGETAADQHTHIVVLDAKTGKAVRTAEVSGIILGQALTNSTLAVETAQNYFPAGSGKGTVTAFSLTDTSTQPSSFPTDKWLVGATRENFMLAPNRLPDECVYGCSLTTVSLVSTNGTTTKSVSGVTAVHPGGWIHRFADPKAASALHLRSKAASEEERKAIGSSWETLEQQLVNPSIKKTIDITGKNTFERGVPTGPGMLVKQEVPDGKGSTESKPVFWLSSTDDGHPHTENLEQFSVH